MFVVLFSLEQKTIYSKCMHRYLVSFLVDNILGEGTFFGDHIQMLSAFLCGRTQHVRCMRSSIVSMIHSIFISRATFFFYLEILACFCYQEIRSKVKFLIY